jgi:hypothetical protein
VDEDDGVLVTGELDTEADILTRQTREHLSADLLPEWARSPRTPCGTC